MPCALAAQRAPECCCPGHALMRRPRLAPVVIIFAFLMVAQAGAAPIAAADSASTAGELDVVRRMLADAQAQQMRRPTRSPMPRAASNNCGDASARWKRRSRPRSNASTSWSSSFASVPSTCTRIQVIPV